MVLLVIMSVKPDHPVLQILLLILDLHFSMFSALMNYRRDLTQFNLSSL